MEAPDDLAALRAQIEALTAAAVKQAQAEQAKRLAEALGLAPSEAAVPTVEDLAAQVRAAQAEARAASLTAAVYRAAREAGVDAEAVSDSRRAGQALAEVDPSDHAAVVAALKALVEGAPGVRARRTPAQSSGDEPRGGGTALSREPFQALPYSGKAKRYPQSPERCRA